MPELPEVETARRLIADLALGRRIAGVDDADTFARLSSLPSLVRIQQADLLESFHKAQSDYGLSTGLAVISEISELILPEHEVSEAMFRLVLLAARAFHKTLD